MLFSNNLSAKEKREILKRIAKGDVRPEDLSTGENKVEMWAEDESDPAYMRMFHPDNNKRIKKKDLDRRGAMLRHTCVTLNLS
jgi:hypothetical protein